ncbi:hypothetical protein GGR55DRAFT_8974 [Xylaria sp. FL0064]|nr:hypothetical protein GGR55DRAFT_8974 [Xylaria sp. FL0064]
MGLCGIASVLGAFHLLCRRTAAWPPSLGFFLKEISAIVRAICQRVRDVFPLEGSQNHTSFSQPRQKLLCSGASVSDSAEENPPPRRRGEKNGDDKKVLFCCPILLLGHADWGWAGRVSL